VDSAQEQPRASAIRLIFEYEGDEVRLVSQQPVDMAVTGFDLTQVPHPGHYVESRDAGGEPLNRVPVREAFEASAEVFPEQPGDPITRIDVPEPRGAFTVVVPAAADAARVVLLQVLPGADPRAARPSGPATSPTAGEPQVVELAAFPLETTTEEPQSR
jgi:hypothetical protein